MLIIIYSFSILFSLLTIPIFIDKETSLPVGIFLMFTPIINTFWFIYCTYKYCIKQKDHFIKDLKKLFDIE